MFLKVSQPSQERIWAGVSFFKKNTVGRPTTLLKKTLTQVFSCEVFFPVKIFFYRTPTVTASTPQVAASIFLLKK